MQEEKNNDSLETLHEIRNIMERSAKFLSLSGWSGIWAGSTALIGAWVATRFLDIDMLGANQSSELILNPESGYLSVFIMPLLLACTILVVALLGGYYFTNKKVKIQGGNIWNAASKSMLKAMIIPLIAGAIFSIVFMKDGHGIYIAPACLIFYGIALVNGSKYTLSEIRYLGLLEVLLGSICLFMPGYGLYFWALGFGLLHILYGIIMWNKYDQ